MFAGRRRRSSNVRVMQLFHELKQQFPTVPDHVVTACIGIATHSNSTNQKEAIREILEAASALNTQEDQDEEEEELMGRSPTEIHTTTTTTTLAPPTAVSPSFSQSSSSQETSSPDEPSLPPISPLSKGEILPPKIGQKEILPPKTGQRSKTSTPGSNLFFPKYLQQEAIDKENEKEKTPNQEQVLGFDMNENLTPSSDINQNVVNKTGVSFSKKSDSVCVNNLDHGVGNELTTGNNSFYIKRPNHLDIHPDFPSTKKQHNIQLSEKCSDVHKLLNSKICDKPPRSPINSKRNFIQPSKIGSPDLVTKRLPTSPSTSPLDERKKQTATTPTQTTDTLLSGILPNSNSNNNSVTANSVNLSLNVNCSMDVVQSPTTSKRTSMLSVTPQQPWLGQDPDSPRSYTSVNLFLRPPSSEPQPPIDITSQNSSLTYSTSSFDSQKGLQSRLQITVGPSGGSVSSVRLRPRSSYLPDTATTPPTEETMPVRAGSLNNLSDSSEPPVIIKQQARIERLRLELKTEKAHLIVLQNQVADLEKSSNEVKRNNIDDEVEKQLRREIKHLQYQCEQLTLEADKNFAVATRAVAQGDFYNNIYTGQRGPLDLGRPPNRIQNQYSDPNNGNNANNNIQCLQQQQQQYFHQHQLLAAAAAAHNHQQEIEGPKWNCHMCTFLNHPDLDHCEQCDMPRILHVSASPGDNIHIHVTPRLSRRVVHSWVL